LKTATGVVYLRTAGNELLKGRELTTQVAAKRCNIPS